MQRLTVLLAVALLLVEAFWQMSGTAQDTVSTSAIRLESEKPGGSASVGATGTEPIYEAFLATGADSQLAHAAAERVESVAGDKLMTAISAQISNLEARLDARFSNLEARLDSQQSELATIRWAIMLQMAILVLLVGFGFSLQDRVAKFEGRVGTLEVRSTAMEKYIREVHAIVTRGSASTEIPANSPKAEPVDIGPPSATSADPS